MESAINNISDNPCDDYQLYSQHHEIVKLRFSTMTTVLIYAAYILPFCFGIFGNVSVCLIFFQQKKLRSITNTFLMNLCINDLIVLCVSIPMTLSAALLEHWVFGAFLCKLVNFTPTLTALVSTFTVATIAVERWFFIVNKKKFDSRCTIITLVLLWVVSILIALPDFISRHIEEFAPPPISIMKSQAILNANNEANHTDFATIYASQPLCHLKKIYFCVLNPGVRMRIFSYIVITVQYLVPFLFVSVSCYLISHFLERRMQQMRVYQTRRSTTTNKNNNDLDESSKFQSRNFNTDDTVPRKFSKYEAISVTMIDDENTSNHVSTRTRSILTNRKQNPVSMNLNPQASSLSCDLNSTVVTKVRVQSHSERRFHRSRKLLICVAALFTISWLPLTVVQIYLEHNETITRDEPNFVYAFLLIPCYLISSISAWMNPVIYNYINRSFRREFYALYSCCCKFGSSSLSSASFLSARADIRTGMFDRIQRFTSKDMEEKTNITKSCLPHKSGKRLITYADGLTKQASLTEINEHI